MSYKFEEVLKNSVKETKDTVNDFALKGIKIKMR